MRRTLIGPSLFGLTLCVSGCASFQVAGTDDQVGVYRNGFMTTFDSFLSAAEHCLTVDKLAVLRSEANYGQNDLVENYDCIDL